jgi:hypothetical protein
MDEFEKQYHELSEHDKDAFLKRAELDRQRREYAKFNIITWIIDLVIVYFMIGCVFYCFWFLLRLFQN